MPILSQKLGADKKKVFTDRRANFVPKMRWQEYLKIEYPFFRHKFVIAGIATGGGRPFGYAYDAKFFRPNLTFAFFRAWFGLQINFRVRAWTSRPVYNSGVNMIISSDFAKLVKGAKSIPVFR